MLLSRLRVLALAAMCALLCTLPAQADDPAAARLAAMSLRQKIAQMFMVTLHGTPLNQPARAFLSEWQPGAISLFSDNVSAPDSLTALTNAMQQTIISAGGPPLLIAIDQEGGVVARLAPEYGFTQWPTPLVMGAAGAEAARQVGAAVGQELAAVGINMNLAPVADLETTRDNPILARRAFGSDPHMVGEAVAGYISGLQSAGVLATAKHFPGHGGTALDSHAELPRIDFSLERIESTELEPFRRAIEAGSAVVMVGHLWYPALDPAPNTPASLSQPVITGLLRDQLGYDGIIMTDALDMNAIDLSFSFLDAVERAVAAGADLLALGPAIGPDVAAQAMQRIEEAVASGRISEAVIDAAAGRILRAKAAYGILDWQRLDPASAASRVDASAHSAVVEALFRAGVTAVVDRGGLLPVSTSGRIAFIFLATRYQIRDACLPYLPADRTQFVAVSDAPDEQQIAWARAAAQAADTTIVFTQNAVSNPAQQALVNALPQARTIAVAIWSPYDWEHFPQVGAYIATYSPAREAVPAACALLFGAIPAQGRLPIALGSALPAGSRIP